MRHSEMQRLRPLLEAGLARAMSRGAAGAKFGFHREERIECRHEAGRLKEAGSQEKLHITVDILRDGRVGHAGGNRAEDLDGLVDAAFALARAGRTAHFDAYPPAGDYTKAENHSARTAALGRERLVEAGERYCAALTACPGDLHVCAGATRSESEGFLATSGGFARENRATSWGLWGYAQRTAGTDILFVGDQRSWGDVDGRFDIQPIIDESRLQLERSARIVPAPAGRTTLVVTPAVLGMFLHCVWMGIDGRNVAKGESPLRDKLGTRALAPCVTIEDDPHRPFCGGVDNDHDGIPSRRQVLFEDGVLARFLYDLDSACLAGVRPTGNRGCWPYAAHVRPGSRHHDRLVAGVKDGILLHALIGYGQGNLMNGDFSGNISLGFRIENGEITGRVKDTMLAGNLYEVLKDGVELSSDLDYRGMTPWAVLGGVNASARG